MSPPDHSADAGGDPQILEVKRALRDEVWGALEDLDAARFPGAQGRIPNFRGAEAAAELLRGTDAWKATEAVKANPDSPQWPVRQRALEDGLVVYMAVPRLAEEEPFFLLDPRALTTTPRKASSIKGAGRHGRKVDTRELRPVGLVVVGSVAVDRCGARLGKGGGYSDLEFAVASAAGLIGEETVVATTVHPAQVVGEERIPMSTHDVPVDLVVTPDEVVSTRRRPRPEGIVWEALTEEKIAAIPLLQRLRPQEVLS